METISISQAKTNFQEVVKRVLDNGTPTIVMTESGESIVMLTLDEYNAWQETLYLLSTSANAEHLQKSIAEDQAGYTVEQEMNKTKHMTRVELIQSQIKTLPYSEFARLRKWFSEEDWDEWDKQLEADSASGKLDFLIEEALAAKEQNKLQKL